MTEEHSVEPIAIVGLAVRVPGAANAEEFWQNLIDGRESVRTLTREEQLAAGASEADLANPSWVSAAPVLDQLEYFDAELFGMSAREARMADPQHRLFLENAYTALDDAGYDPQRYPGAIGVYSGTGHVRYEWLNLRANRELWAGDAGQLSVTTVNSPDYVSTQVSYRFNLRGPAMTLHTACSTSLVALHLACEALRNGECDMALAGGVSVELPHGVGYLGMEGYTSPDGHCRPFDAKASGTVWGSGAGVVLLKRLADAIADGDHIRAVVRGNAINNDGSGKVGFSAPSVDGQTEVIAQAVEVAGIDPRSITYVEAHGTGTALGDPIEVAALTSVYGPHSRDRQWCALGSVKSNIGHLSQAAGVVGVIKAVLALEHGIIPPSLNFEEPNPEIDFAQSPFFVAVTPSKFEPVDGRRRAAVSSFGVGGTNAHVVLEQAPDPEPLPAAQQPLQLVQLSARTPTALQTMATNLAEHLSAGAPSLADVAHTLRTGRRLYPHRAAVVARDASDAAAALRTPKRWHSGDASGPAPRVALLFSGQGAQYAQMGAELYQHEPVFAAAVDECLQVLGDDLRAVLFDPDGGEQLQQTRYTQPALFVIEYALARLWESWGVRPEAMIGHSVGEYVAATLAGVFAPADAVRLVARRGELMQSMPEGAMLAVTLDEAQVAPRLPEQVVIATVNGPGTCVVAGPTEAVQQFADSLAADGIGARMLRTSHAFHSPMMDPVLAAFEAEVAAVPRSAPQRPFWSNVTGEPITAEQATDPAYWAQHLRQAVRFGDCVASVLRQPGSSPWVLLECGPGRQLAGLARLQVARDQLQPLPSLPSAAGKELETLYGTAGHLWAVGVPVHLSSAGRRVPLPTYPFERKRYWADPDPVQPSEQHPTTAGPAEAEPLPVTDRYAVPTWRQLPPLALPGQAQPAQCTVLVAGPRGRELAAALRADGTVVTELGPGDEEQAAASADHIVHALTLDSAPAGTDPQACWQAQQDGFLSALRLVTAVAAQQRPTRLDLVSSDTEDPVPAGLSRPEHATLAGIARVAPLEVDGLVVRRIDAASNTPAATVAAEVAGGTDAEVALRGGRRWGLDYAQVSLAAREPELREGGCYLITGGLGGVGITLAEDLARHTRGEIVLVSRSGLPPRQQWDEHLATHGFSDRTGRSIAAIRRMEHAGARVRVVAADVTDPADVRRLREEGVVPHGIIHAAGVAGGGMAELRSAADVEAVLAPKLRGTLALQQAFGDLPLDFVLLCSSVTAVTGGLGQVDYCAANAFLDAYARSEHGWNTRLVSVNWGGWSEVGMAAEIDAPEALRAGATTLAHPVLSASEDRTAYGRIGADTHWVLNEHRIASVPVVPGTGHVECARAAAAVLLPSPGPDHVMSLHDVAFTEPLSVPEGTTARYEVHLGQDGQFEIRSRTTTGVRTHAQGRAAWVAAPAAAPLPLEQIRQRCTDNPQAATRGSIVSFGPRWDCLREIHAGDGEELALLELPQVALDDHERWTVHPALLDVATTFGFRSAQGTYLPMGYGKVVVRGALPARCYSYVRYHSGADDVIAADITLCGPDGEVWVEISDFMLRRVDADAIGSGLASPQPEAATITASGSRISPEEGVLAMRHLLAADLGPQVAVSALPLAVLRERAQQTTTETVSDDPVGDPSEVATGDTGDESDTSGADFVAPRTDLEKQLAEVWGNVLGVARVGAEDDFFTLGGNSLVAVQLVAQVRSAVKVKLPMRTLFEHPTVAGMAAQVEALRQQSSGSAQQQSIPKLPRGGSGGAAR